MSMLWVHFRLCYIDPEPEHEFEKWCPGHLHLNQQPRRDWHSDDGLLSKRQESDVSSYSDRDKSSVPYRQIPSVTKAQPI